MSHRALLTLALLISALFMQFSDAFRPQTMRQPSSTIRCRLSELSEQVEEVVEELHTEDGKEPFVARKSDNKIEWNAAVRSQAKVKESKRTAEEYMALPASQYSVLSADQIERLSDSQFKATLGKLNFFGNTFIPILYVDVNVYPDEARAEIVVNRAETTGSEIADKVSGTFDIKANNCVSAGLDRKGRKVLISDTSLAIHVKVPEEAKLPIRVIRSGGNFIIQQSLNLIVPTFIRILASDFKRWSAGDDTRDAIDGASLS
jgi:hypothetical protein